MASFLGYLFTYILGGLTFVPLVGIIALVYIKGGIEPILNALQQKKSEPLEISNDFDNVIVKKGWIRITNQYQPKMPDLSNSSNGRIISGIQSYVNKNDNDSKDNASHKSSKKKGVVYAVLKHGTLFCFESEKQNEVLMILPMQDYQISLFAPSFEQKSEGEIYSRTTVVCLVPNGFKQNKDDISLTSNNSIHSIDSVCTLSDDDITCHPTRPLYMTCSRNTDKEDWYFGLLDAHQMLQAAPKDGPEYIMVDSARFDQKALEKLTRQVQLTPSQRELSWLNAILGRIFLSTYKTDFLKNYFEMKIRKKIDKTKRPTFLDEIHVRSVDVGDSVPFITDPKLLSLSAEGEVIVEAKMEYSGGLTIEIETDFNWSYYSRMKPIRMHLVLAVKLKKLAGRLMFKLKAPPSNRYWLAFFEMPEMEWKITPVVADKQIKLNLVTNAIESRIREVMAETFVLPNMNDFPFFESNGKGGIFGEYQKVQIKRSLKKSDLFNGSNDSIQSESSNSIKSTNSSRSSTSSKHNSPPHIIKENPTVPEAAEKSNAMDILKLKNRGAESVTDLKPVDELASNLTTSLHKLETSRSTPEMQQAFKEDGEGNDKSLNSQDLLKTSETTTSSASTGSRWSTGSYLRRRSRTLNEESNDSDADSIKSNHSHKLFSKISSYLPSEHHHNGNNSDSTSVRSTNNTGQSRKQAIMQLAGNFLNKKNNNLEQDEIDSKPINEVSKKDLYTQRIASIRKRVEEKMGSKKSFDNNPIPPPIFQYPVSSDETVTDHTIIQTEPIDDAEASSKRHSVPPEKPHRSRANTATSTTSNDPVLNNLNILPINESTIEKPPLPPRKNSIHSTQLDNDTITSSPVNISNEMKEETPKVIDNQLVDTMDLKKDDTPIKLNSLEEKDTIPVIHQVESSSNEKIIPVVDIEQNNDNLNENDQLLPPLPSTPRPKRSSSVVTEQVVPPLPNTPRPSTHIHKNEQTPPSIPPRSNINQNYTFPPSVPPRPQ